MSDNMPDFDSMTPEEIQTWMESLAKRQGASEGFTTAADMSIDEIDPDSVVIDEPGYVPYGQESKQPPAPAKTEEKPTPVPEAPAPQVVQPIRAPEPEPQVQMPPAAQVTPVQPPASPVRPPAPVAPPTPEPQPEPAVAENPVDEGALAWLESLAADQGEELFNLDLSELPDEASEPSAAALTNPMTWLEDLARSQVAEPSLEQLGGDDQEESEKLDPFAEGVNSMEWLETLAKRQGARSEELTTNASMNIPQPETDEVEEEDYQPFSFDTPPAAARRTPEPADQLENPADWLTSLAGEEGYNEEGVGATRKTDALPDELSMEAIQEAISNGTVTREQMQVFLDEQSEQLAQQPEIEYVDDEEAEEELEPAELPDWLSELKPDAQAPEPTTPITSLFEAVEEAPAVPADMPDWLKETPLEEETLNLEDIFEPEPEDEESEPVTVVQDEDLAYDIEVDANDPWVEAFDLEYEQGMADIDTVPEWYEQNLNDPARIAAVEEQEASQLEEAGLPALDELPAGQAQTVPGWVSGFEAVEEAPVTAENVFEDMPDWLKDVEASVSPEEVPDWLVETITVEEPVAEVIQPPVQEVVTPPPPKPAAHPPPPAPKPAPMPARVAVGSAGEVLDRARDKEQSGDLEGALAEYEALIRANTDLETVVADLTQLVKSYKTTPAVYRVLGDGLMRQGKLQAALNTYREALNQL